MIAMKSLAVAACLFTALVARDADATASPRKTNSGLPEKWSGTATVVLDPSLEDLGHGAADEVRRALTTWLTEVAGLPNVVFEIGTVRTSASFDGKNVVLAGPITMPGQQDDLALTTTYASDETGDILEADVVFNTKYAFAVMPSPAPSCAHLFDVGAVATHECGHFFGLGEDYEDTTTTMFITTDPCDAHKRVLTPKDITSLSAIYERQPAPSAQCDEAPSSARGDMFGVSALWLALACLGRRMGNHDARRRDYARSAR